MDEEYVYAVTIKLRTQFTASERAKEIYKGGDELCGGGEIDDFTKEWERSSDFVFREAQAAIEYCNAWKSRFIEQNQGVSCTKRRPVKVLRDDSYTEGIDDPNFHSAQWTVELELSNTLGTTNKLLTILVESMAVVDFWPYATLSHNEVLLDWSNWEPREFATVL